VEGAGKQAEALGRLRLISERAESLQHQADAVGDRLIGWRRRFTGSFTWVRRLAFSQNLASSYDRDAEPPPAPGPGYLLPN
jgi:hypothetical protein